MKWATTTTTAATKENRLFHDIIISPISNFIYTACESTTTLSLSLYLAHLYIHIWVFRLALWQLGTSHSGNVMFGRVTILPPAEVAVSRLTKEILVPKCRAPICVGHFFFLSHSHAIGTKAYHNFWQRARRLPISNSQDIDSSFIKVSVFAYVRTLKEKTKDTSEQERENGCFALAKVIKGFSCDVVVGRKWNANQTMFQTLKRDEEGSTIFESRNANWISFTRWQLVSIVYLPIHTYLTIYTIRSFFSTYL